MESRHGTSTVVGATSVVLAWVLSAGTAGADPGITTRVSVDSSGAQANGDSFIPAISADGRFVAFESDAENLVPPDPGDNNRTRDVFVHDRLTGETEIVSVGPDGTPGDQYSGYATISADGHSVAFSSVATTFATGDANLGGWDVFVRDHVAETTTRASVPRTGTSLDGIAFFPSLSADGRYVAFASGASNLTPGDTNQLDDVFVRDLVAGVTTRVAIPPGQESNGASSFPSISDDGRYVAFSSEASNLVPQDTNGLPRSGGQDVFVHDLATSRTERVSVSSTGVEGNSDSLTPDLSGDGRFVAFLSLANSFVPGDADGGIDPVTGAVSGDLDLYVHDRLAGTTDRVSLTATDGEPDRASDLASISADGRVVAFVTDATNMGGADENDAPDVFVRDRGLAAGVGGLTARPGAGVVEVSGWATFSGAAVVDATDPAADGGPGARDLGAELLGAGLVYRPERGDLLARFRLAAIPGARPYHPSVGTGARQYGHLAPSLSGAPGIVYTMELTRGSTRYEVRATRLRPGGSAEPVLSLWRCAPECVETATLEGSYGQTGDEVVVAVPLAAIGAAEGDAIGAVRARTGVGDADRGEVQPLDDLPLVGGVVPLREVSLAIAPAGTPEYDVTFGAAATLAGGDLAGSITTEGLPAGSYDVWARACLADQCGAVRVPVTI